MDVRAHNILSSVIAEQGMQLANSDAYCKVYLAGHMTDYPEEKQTLVALKALELPNALLDFNSTILSKPGLFIFIEKLCAQPNIDDSSVAWGVDAWAAALDVSEAVRRDIRKQCFSDVSQRLNTDSEYHEVESLISRLDMGEPSPKTQSMLGKSFKTVTASAVSLVALTVFGAHSIDTLDPVVTSEQEAASLVSKLEIQAPLTSAPLNILQDPTENLVESTTGASAELANSDLVADFSPKVLDESEIARPSLLNLTPLIIQESKSKGAGFKLVKNKLKKVEASQRVSTAPTSVFNPKNQQLNADVENFLINGN